jgi:hypothetical protein
MKVSLKDRIKRLQIPLNFWTVGGASLVLVLIGYAILLPYLRFYLDDWPQLYSMKVFGLYGLKQYFLFDGRPIGYWPDYLGFLAFGTNAALWHLSIYLTRWLTVMFMWATFVMVWPKHKVEISLAALLFAIYPIFAQMQISITFTAHFACYLFFFISTYFMALAIRKRKYFWLFLVLAIAFDLVNLFTYEYYIGLEFLRPLLIWFILREDKGQKKIFGKVIAHWLPYLASSMTFIFYRIFLLQTPLERNTPSVLLGLFPHPLSNLLSLFQDMVGDTMQLLLETWHDAFNPSLIDFTLPAQNIAIVISILAALVFLIFVYLTFKPTATDGKPDKEFTWQALIIGFLGIVFGCAPGWSIGRTASDTSGIWNDRFALAAMFAAALFIVVFVFWLFGNHYWRKVLLITFLVGIAAGQNFRVTNDFRWSSTYQTRFSYELSWRAPYIESPTALFADNEMFIKMGVYPTSFLLNLLYPNKQDYPNMNYYFYTLNKYFPTDAADLANNMEVTQSHWYANFATSSENSLVFSWHPLDSQCLWILTENDRYNPSITDLTKQALGATNLSRISTATTPGYPDVSLFGKESTNEWCYYFEKGDLDRQLGNWSDAVSLYETAVAKGFTTTYGQELMPFIEAYAHEGNGEKALELTKVAAGKKDHMTEYICDNWIRISGILKDDASVQAAFKTVYDTYNCSVIDQ